MTPVHLAAPILWSHPSAIVAIDGERRVRYANRAALDLLANANEPVEGRDVAELFGGDHLG